MLAEIALMYAPGLAVLEVGEEHGEAFSDLVFGKPRIEKEELTIEQRYPVPVSDNFIVC
ncbi:MAG: hypothetical protein ACREQW_03330 [Candidatus Binatia bacterium]